MVNFEVNSAGDIIGLRVILTPSAEAADTLARLTKRPVSQADAEAVLCHSAYREVQPIRGSSQRLSMQ